MKTICIDNLIEEIRYAVKRHNLGKPGEYARWLWQVEDSGYVRDLGINPYGCADAANILYTISEFPREKEEREGFVRAIRGMQDEESGLFCEPTHHSMHTTAHCLAALELFDAKPLYPCTALKKYTTKEGLYDLLENEINWNNPWRDSHLGAGVFVCLTMTDAVDLEWKNDYFRWFWENSDEKSGFFLYGDPKEALPHHIMGGGFHYMFNHEAERRPYRYPDKIIDFCMEFLTNPEPYGLAQKCSFLDVDAVFSMNRAMRQTPHRFCEAKEVLESFAECYLAYLYSLDHKNHDQFNDLHVLFGVSCCLAELQMALPGKILTSKPLRLVLDRRPFI